MPVKFTLTSRVVSAIVAVLFLYGYLYSNLMVAFTGAAVLFYLVYRKLEFESLRRRVEMGVYREILEKAVHKDTPFTVRLEIRCNETVGVRAADRIPQHFRLISDDTVVEGVVHPENPLSITYTLRPIDRGYFRFPPLEIEIREARGLFTRNIRLDPDTTVLVQASLKDLALARMMAKRKQFEITGQAYTRHTRTFRADFKSIRDYMPGDRLRDIDWKAGARLTKLMTKEFDLETNLPTVLLMDASYSMRELIRRKTKLDHAQGIAIQIANVLHSQGHPVGMISFNENRILENIPPRKMDLDDLLLALFRLPNPAESESYPGLAHGDAPPKGDVSGGFVSKVGPFLVKGRRHQLTSEKATGIFEAVRAIQREGKSGQVLILISDLETNRFAMRHALTAAMRGKHRVILISPFSWPYHLRAEELGEKVIERMYREYMDKAKWINTLRTAGVKVIEITSKERGDKVITALRRMGQ